jgi:inosose dehydratase
MEKAEMETRRGRTRREFVKAASLGAASVAGGLGGFAMRTATAEERASGSLKGKIPFRLGLASYSLRKFSLEESLAMANRVGLKYICLKSFHLPLDSSPEDIAKAATKVKEAGIVLYGGGVITMRNESQVAAAFEYAKAAGMTTIVGMPMPEVLPLVNEKVRGYDIQVAIHNHGPGDNIYPTPESAYQKIKGLDKRIGLCIDVGHTTRIGADPIRSAKLYSDRLLDVHIKDVSEASPEGKEVEVGRGVIDVPRFLRTLVRIGYTGIVAFEYEKDPEDPLAGLAESVGYVKGVLAAI